MIGLLTGIVSLIAGGVERFQQKKMLEAENAAAIAKAETEAAIARLHMQAKGEMDWDTNAAAQMDRSWKDEWWTVLFSIPLFLNMMPFDWAQLAAAKFWQGVDAAPDWYVGGLGVMIAASFGYRKFADFMMKRAGA